jgi:lysozyme
MTNKIIDVSSNNGQIDWNEVINDGVSDVIIRLSLGFGDRDKLAPKYAQEAVSVGLSVSYYHLAYPDAKQGTVSGDATQEANYFTSLFQAGQMPAPKWLAVDLEKMSNGWDTPLNKTEYLNWLQVFLSQVYSNTGVTCFMYSNKPYLDAHLPVNHGLGAIPLWIANYNNISSPPLPKGWSQYFLWQYSETGLVQGINGSVDLNITSQTILLESLVKKYLKSKKKRNTLTITKTKKGFKGLFAEQLPLQQIYTKINSNNNSPFSKELIATICWAESNFKPDNVSDDPSSTSKGLMMMNNKAVDTVNANTPRGVHFEYDDMYNPDLAIACGTWYLKILYIKPDWNCQTDKRQTLTVFRHGKNSTDYIYTDKALVCEGCLQSTVILNQQTCLNQIHT